MDLCHDLRPDTPTDVDVLILGGSIAALMAGSYLKLQHPELRVVLLGPEPDQEKRPIVGESLVEPATFFFRGIGMGDVLNQGHAVKHGLSFYYKLNPEDPADPRYSVHSPERMFCLARHLQRPRFDRELRARARELGVEFVRGKAMDATLRDGDQRHEVVARVSDQSVKLTCRWILDATGRQRWLGRRVTSYTRPQSGQRSVFWFRLANFQSFDSHIQPTMRRPLPYDRYFTTHHFMGHGNWVWGIPLQSPQHQRLMSIGITYRPDLFDHPMRNMDDFLTFMDGEHPAVAHMVRSGEILDTQTYGNFLYWADQVYSPDRWFLIGDAARAVDPLYSSGLSMTSIQIEQISTIIAHQRNGGISPEEINNLQRVWMAIASRRQEDITNQYETMHIPFAACMRRYWNITVWFNAVLPMWWNGLLSDVQAVRVLAPLFEQGYPAWQAARRLFRKVADHLGPEVSQADFDRAPDFDWLLNLRYDCAVEEIPAHFRRFFDKIAAFRWTLLKMSRFRDLPFQLPFIIMELGLAWLMPHWLRWNLPDHFPKIKGRRPFANEDLSFHHGEGDRTQLADDKAVERREKRREAA